MGYKKLVKFQILLPISMLLVYGQCIFFGYQFWDDGYYLLNNPFLKEFSLSSIKALFTPGSLPEESLYIPLSYISFLPNGALFGLNSHLAHGVNVGLHIVNTLLVFTIIQMLLSAEQLGSMDAPQLRSKNSANTTYIAGLAAIIFAFHPIQVESVAWAFSRRELLGALFMLASMLYYLKFLTEKKLSYYGAAVVFCVCAVLSKPNIMLVPLIFPIIHILLHKSHTDETNTTQTGYSISRALRQVIPFIMIMVCAYFLNANQAGERPGVLVTAGYLPYIAHEWLLRLFYVSEPYPFYMWPDLSTKLIAWPYLLLPLSGVIGIICLIRDKRVVPCVSLLFFFLAIAPAGHIILMKNRDFYTADRYGYLAMAGIAGFMAWLVFQLPVLKTKMATVCIVCICITGPLCFLQLGVWKTPRQLSEYALRRNPGNATALTLLGNHHVKEQRIQEGIRYYRKAVSINLRDEEAWQNLYVLAREAKGPEEGSLYRHWQVAQFEWTYTTYLAGKRLKRQGETRQAIALIETRIAEGRIKTNCPDLYFLMGSLYQLEKQWTKALASYSLCLKLAPEKDAARFNLGVCALNTKRYQVAVECFEYLLKHQDPEDHLLHFNLGVAYLNLNQPNRALKHLLACKQANPMFPQVYDPLIHTYILLNNIPKAQYVSGEASHLDIPIRKKTKHLLELNRSPQAP